MIKLLQSLKARWFQLRVSCVRGIMPDAPDFVTLLDMLTPENIGILKAYLRETSDEKPNLPAPTNFEEFIGQLTPDQIQFFTEYMLTGKGSMFSSPSSGRFRPDSDWSAWGPDLQSFGRHGLFDRPSFPFEKRAARATQDSEDVSPEEAARLMEFISSLMEGIEQSKEETDESPFDLGGLPGFRGSQDRHIFILGGRPASAFGGLGDIFEDEENPLAALFQIENLETINETGDATILDQLVADLVRSRLDPNHVPLTTEYYLHALELDTPLPDGKMMLERVSTKEELGFFAIMKPLREIKLLLNTMTTHELTHAQVVMKNSLVAICEKQLTREKDTCPTAAELAHELLLIEPDAFSEEAKRILETVEH